MGDCGIIDEQLVQEFLLTQAVQKCLDARRAWFDKLTMTNCAACPEPAEGRGVAQHEDAVPAKAGMSVFQQPVKDVQTFL